jgi:pyruvate dehydrogenase E2 component (dihydrolipoamide acetyltransferase)
MDVLMPQLGETVAEGTVAAWHKQVGDRVEADEIILDVETDKVSMEIPAPAAGTLAKILVEAGQTVEVGTVLAVVQAEGESLQEPAGGKPRAGARADEAAAAAPSSTGSPASSPAPMASRTNGSGGNGAAAAGAAASARAGTAAPRSGEQRLSPAVRRLAAEHDLELDRIEGTGRNGRITRRDVLKYLEGAPAAKAAGAAAGSRARAPAPASQARPPAGLEGGVVPFNRIRKLTAKHMVQSKATSPHVLQAVEVDFSNVDRVRKSVREAWRGQRGYSLTYLPFIANAVCQALAEFPNANASVEGDSLVLHEHVNLAIAVDLGPDGLVAPVIPAAETLSVAQIAEAIQDVASRARQGRLRPDDLSGGTYTLSNSGTFGTLITAPIINQPQVAILSTDGVRKKPVVIEHPEGDSIAIRPIGILAQSFDHRAIDGAYSAAFLDRVRKILERSQWTVEI